MTTRSALTPLAHWLQQSLPRGLAPEEIRRVLAACPPTPRGLRDRAALLLLIRLGLRAGEVSKLRFSDLCFEADVGSCYSCRERSTIDRKSRCLDPPAWPRH